MIGILCVFTRLRLRPFLGGGDAAPLSADGESLPCREVPPIQVYGNTHGLKASQTRQIERLFRRRMAADQILSNELARHLSEISQDIHRQVGVLVDRRGSVQHVMVGNAQSIELPDWGRLRAGRGRLRGLRCIHTHLAIEGLTRDDLTDLALLRLDAIVSIAVREDGLPGLAHAAALRPASRDGDGDDHPNTGTVRIFDRAWCQYVDNTWGRVFVTQNSPDAGIPTRCWDSYPMLGFLIGK